MSDVILTAIIGVLGGGGLGAALIGFLKDRKKDNATAKLTDVQALQQQVLLLTQITDYLRKENDQLHIDLEESDETKRKMRIRMAELEEELQQVKLSAARTQAQCDDLSAKLKAFVNGEEKI